MYTGFHCEEHDNPADFFLDVVTSCERAGNNEGDSASASEFQCMYMYIILCVW